ncbi:metal-dependent hydrolase [Methanosarcina sp.]|uniref:metal-dependent hydrolase n=1 Tax=Methanosarcina sp. TaxID=2213 RepID=UPI002ABBDCCD|nr:metal-dependent hydrolase [Methanosarcina sp.]MDY9925284.1 metal-dependent hydrolase [Methanosarcina sp.]
MTGRKTHMTAGVLISFILVWCLVPKGLVLSSVLLPTALASSAFGAVLPDLIEPPRNRRHRKFFHSLLCLAFLLLFLNQTYLNLLTADPVDEITLGLFFAGSGYVSHLMLDALTPAGLPVVGL